VACVSKEFEGSNCHALIIVSPYFGRLLGRFLSYFLNSSFGFEELKSIQTGALHPHLNCGLVVCPGGFEG
jgi:type I restriction enzyme S subunit